MQILCIMLSPLKDAECERDADLYVVYQGTLYHVRAPHLLQQLLCIVLGFPATLMGCSLLDVLCFNSTIVQGC